MDLSPSYDSTGLVNLVAEIEATMTGSAVAPRLGPQIGSLIPDTDTLVLVLFDGLGVAQLAHPRAGLFRDSLAATLHAGFPTTTSVSLATIATGLPPSQHGIVSHLMWMPDHDRIVNTLKWVDLSGSAVSHDFAAVLPGPNLWERLRSAGIEPITVQPGDFQSTPLTRMLYRGARFEGIWDIPDLIEATVQLAAEPGRLIFTYVPQVDFAGHVFGLESTEFGEALDIATRIWDELARRLQPGVTLLGTADHGLIEYSESDKLLIRQAQYNGLRFGGDTRGVHLWTEDDLAASLRDLTGGVLVDPASLIGPQPSPDAIARSGTHLLLAPDHKALLPRGFDKRLRAYHGGLAPAERDIPLLIG